MTAREEGLRALYRGFLPTFFGCIPYEGLKFGAYSYIKGRLRPLAGSDAPTDEPPPALPPHWNALHGALAGLTASAACYPLDSVRRLMQVGEFDAARGRHRHYGGVANCVRALYRQGGVARFYRGLSSRVCRIVPGCALQFAVFDALKALALAPDGP